MPTTKADLLGATSPAIIADSDHAKLFDPVKVSRVMKVNSDYSSVPCYCRCCGITSYVSQEEAKIILEENHRDIPDFQPGVYVDSFGCPYCTGKRGTDPIVKHFDVIR
jgi:hypothetical protein